MDETEFAERRNAILDAAFRTFVSYGFKRTTMADIAAAAGMSRPALYQHFRNKNDIYRAKFQQILEHSQRNVTAAFATEAPVEVQIMAAIHAAILDPMKGIVNTPHGEELFALKQDLAADLGDDWANKLEASLAGGIEAAAGRGMLDLARGPVASETMARLIVSTVEGIKMRTSDWQVIEADITTMIALLIQPLAKPV